MKQIVSVTNRFVVGTPGVFWHQLSESPSLTWYNGSYYPTEAAWATPWTSAGTFSRLFVSLSAAPVGSRTFLLRVNGADTALSVTISGGDTTGSDIINTVAIAQDDLVNLQVTSTGGTGGTVSFALVFDSANNFDSAYTFGGAGAGYCNMFRGDSWNGIDTAAWQVVPIAGNLTRYRIQLLTAPGLGKSWHFSVYKNSVSQDGTGGTVDTTLAISDSAVSGVWSGTLNMSPGDEVHLASVGVGSPASPLCVGCATVSATTPGDFIVASSGGNGLPSATVTEWWGKGDISPAPDGSFASLESQVANLVPMDCSLRTLYVYTIGAPGVGKSFAYSTRVNGAAPAIPQTVTLTGTGSFLSGSDLSHRLSLSSGDTFDLETDPTGTPTQPYWSWAWGGFAALPPSCSGGGEIDVVADPADGQPFTGRSLSPRSWLTYDYDDASRGFSLDTLNHPDTFYGGQKLGNLISLGTVERALSGRDSPYKMGNGQAEVDDSSRLLSTLEAAAGSEFWFNREITVNLAPASSVALAQTPHTRFRGIVTGYPTVGLQRSIAFTSVLGSEFSPLDLDRMIPSRQIKDDFPDAPTDSLDKYVPIGMGIFPDRGATAVPITTGVENVVATLQTGPAAVTGFTATWGAGAPGGTFGDYRDLGEGILLFYEVRQRVGGVWSEPAQTSVTTGAGGGHVDLAWTPSGSATAIQIAVSGRSDFLQFSCLTTELSGATTTATDITGGIKDGFNTLDIWTLGLRINEFYIVFAALDDGSFSLGGGSNQLIIAPAFPDRLYNADVTWDAYTPPAGRTVTGYRIIRHRSYYSDWGPVYDWQGEVGAAVLTVADVGHGTAYYDSYVDNPLVQFPGGASSQDGVVIAIPAGKEVIGGTTYNRLVLFGHAIRDIDGIYKSRDIQGAATTSTVPIYDAVAASDFGSTWLAPGYTGWPFANDYVPYGTDNNWYTVIFTTIDPLPTSILVRCCAMEDVGDSTGSTIDGADRQFFHLFQNFILPPAGEVWTSGAWLAPRTFDDGTPVINSLAIDALEAIEVNRIGRYYRGQIYLDQPISIRTLLERFFDSFGIRFGENHHGQLIGVHLDDFADLSSLTVLTDVREIVGDTRMDPRLTEMANTELYDYGYRPAESKQFLRLNESQSDSIAIGVEADDTVSPAIARTGNRGRVKSHSRQMYFVDDPYTADDVVARDLAFYKYPPRYVQIVCGFQAVPVTLGSIVAVTDFQGIGADGWTERPLWVLGIQDVYNDLNTPPTIVLTCVDVLRVLSGFGLWADGSVPNWASSTKAEQVNNMYWADASDLMSDGAPAKVWG